VKRVFIVGCPRSGSTWVTFLLAQHAKVATFQHAKVFDYLVRMQQWHRNKAEYSFIVDPLADGSVRPKRDEHLRLAEVLPEADLAPLLGHVASGIVDSVAELRPGVSVVVDKTPENGHLAEFVKELLPDAYFLHIVRDPRSVFCSHRSAGASWAKWEFPQQPVDGARFWRHDVETARRIGGFSENYLQVRYEDLKQQGPAELARIFSWLGLEADDEFCVKALAASSKDKVRESKELPQGFVRKVPAGGWRDELSRGDVRIIEYLAGDLMEDLGYERAEKPARTKPLRVRVHDLMDPVFAFVEKKLHRITQLAHWRWVGRKLDWPDP
jgi:hypothetical protein